MSKFLCRSGTGVGFAALLATTLCLSSVDALAQAAWPSKPVRLIAPSGAGTFTDLVARALAAELGDQLGQQVVVENRPGAGTTIGVGIAANSALFWNAADALLASVATALDSRPIDCWR